MSEKLDYPFEVCIKFKSAADASYTVQIAEMFQNWANDDYSFDAILLSNAIEAFNGCLMAILVDNDWPYHSDGVSKHMQRNADFMRTVADFIEIKISESRIGKEALEDKTE